MIIPVIYPSSGEFWTTHNPNKIINYSFNNRQLTSLPAKYNFCVDSWSAGEVAEILGVEKPLYLSSPHEKYKRKGSKCVVLSHVIPFPPDSFVFLNRGNYDIYIASPELSFLLAARSLDLIDLVKFGYDLCAMFNDSPSSKYCRTDRSSYTFVSYIQDYVKKNSKLNGSAKALKALRHVHDFSNSPIETRLAIIATLPPELGGFGIPGLEMNKAIDLTAEGKRITGYAQIRGDLVFQRRLVVEYNSNSFHLDPRKYTDDMNRQTALKLAGCDYIAITAGNIKYMHSLVDIMKIIRIKLGLPPLDDSYENARTELYFRLFP